MQRGFFEGILLDSLKAALTEIMNEQGAKAVIYHLRLGEKISVPLIHTRIRELLGLDGATIIENLMIKQFLRRLEIPYEKSEVFDFEALLLKAVMEFSQKHILIYNA